MLFLMIVHILICIFLVFVILLQPGKSDGGGIGFGSSSQSIFGSKGAGNFLTKTTSVCAIVFLFTSFLLTRSRMKEYSGSVIGKEPVQQEPAKVPAANPGASDSKAADTKSAEPAKAGAPAAENKPGGAEKKK